MRMDNGLVRAPIRRQNPETRYSAATADFILYIVAGKDASCQGVVLASRFHSKRHALASAYRGAHRRDERRIFGIERMYNG